MMVAGQHDVIGVEKAKTKRERKRPVTDSVDVELPDVIRRASRLFLPVARTRSDVVDSADEIRNLIWI
jgi:hypothetical protein